MSAPTTAAEVLAAHQWRSQGGVTPEGLTFACSCGWLTHVDAGIAPVHRAMKTFYAHQADALREAGLLVSPERDREVAAKAWDEGATAEARGAGFEPALELNPYREET